MNDSTKEDINPTRELAEVRLVAMLLGEASPFEEEQLREQLKQDVDLAKFCAEIEKTLPVLKEAFDVGQAGKAKSSKPRLARKRRKTVKQLFRSDPGLAKRKVVRPTFHKVLAIAAVVCAVLLVVSALLLPASSKPKASFTAATQQPRLEPPKGGGEAAEENRSVIVDNYARVGGVQLASEAVPTPTQAAPKTKMTFTRGNLEIMTYFASVDSAGNNPDSTVLTESLEESAPVGGESTGMAVITGVTPMRVTALDDYNGQAATPELVTSDVTSESTNIRDSIENNRQRGRADNRVRRQFVELAMPETKSEGNGETAATGEGAIVSVNGLADHEMAARVPEGRKQALFESRREVSDEDDVSRAGVQKNVALIPAAPTNQPVPRFANKDAQSESSSAGEPAEGAELYGFQNQLGREFGEGKSADMAGVAHGMAATTGNLELGYDPPTADAAPERDFGAFPIDSLHSVAEADRPKMEEYFKSPTLPGPATPPMPQAGAKVLADNGRTSGWYYEAADKSAINNRANVSADGRAQGSWDTLEQGQVAARQWGNYRGEIVGEDRKKANLIGGMGGMGGGGFGDAYASDFYGGQAQGLGMPNPGAMGGAPQDLVSSEGEGATTLSLNVDGNGRIELDGKPGAFGRGQRAQALETKGVLGFAGRAFRKSSNGVPVTVGQPVHAGAVTEMLSVPANEFGERNLAKGKSAQLEQAAELDQSGVADLFFDDQLSRGMRQKQEHQAIVVTAGAFDFVTQDEEVEEEGQTEVPTLGDVPVLGSVFRRLAEPAKAARELEATYLELTVDEKARPQRSRSSRVSGRQSQSRFKEDADALAELPAEEYESLATAVNETKSIPTSSREQLMTKAFDVDRKRVASRKPRGASESGKEVLLQGVKQAEANKKLSVRKPTAKPQSAQPLSRLSLAKREESLKLKAAKVEEKLRQELKEIEKEPPQPAKPPAPSVVYTPRPETLTAQNNFSTFSLNVSDVSFKTTLASLQTNKLPEPGDVRSEEFLNALEYRDPMPRAGEPLAFHWERARSPFAHDRDIVRFSVRTAALGRQPGRAINLVCLLDNSGSMEREDRVSIVQQALSVLARKLTPNDRVSLVTFSRTPKLRIDGMRGGNREAFLKASTGWIPQGGTHVEKALVLAYETAKKHFIPGGNNRVILLTDGAANMGNVDPYQLRKTVEANRKQGIALDCFGIGWEGYNDNLLKVLARNGDGRYGFLDQPVQAVAEFEQKLLGAFQVAASDVKTQVEWNSKRVTRFRQVGYLRHQLKKEDFRNNKVDAAEISAAEAGNALYVIQINPDGEGPLGMVRVRYKVPFTNEYTELEWSLAYEPAAAPLEQAGPAMRLGCVAATFAEWLAQNPYAQGVQLADLQGLMSGIPSIYATDERPAQLEWMIGKARILAGN